MKHLTPLTLAGISLLLFPIHQINAQTENPTQTTILEIVKPPDPKRIIANVTPIFWKAAINKSSITLPLRNIEFYGVQDYVIDDLIRVRELTISTHARSLIRIYYIRPLELVERAKKTFDAAKKIEELKKIATGKTGGDERLPVKVFPITTHSNMVEYRVDGEKQVDELYQHLDATMIEYHARYLIEGQRNLTIREIKVDN